jgi:CelD/BcsL family acetyltransferase involved in cellulose biosynthesis
VESRWLEGADVVRALPEFLRVREARLRAKGRPLDGMPISLIDAVVPRLAAAGSCAFADLRIDGRMVARDLYLLDPPVALLWLRALDIGWRRVPCGHLLLRSTAQELAADGYDVLDLGTGDEPYKFVFGAQRRALLRASLAAAPCEGRTRP